MRTKDEFELLRTVLHKVPSDTLQSLIETSWNEYDTEHIMKKAIQENDLELLKKLVESGVAINKKINSINYNSYLDVAVRYKKLEIAKFLIENSLKFKNEKDPGYRAILIAANSGNLEMFQLLVENGADLNIEFGGRLDTKINLLSIAEKKKLKNIFNYILTIKEKFSPKKQKEIDNMRIRMIFKN